MRFLRGFEIVTRINDTDLQHYDMQNWFFHYLCVSCLIGHGLSQGLPIPLTDPTIFFNIH